MRSSTTLPGWVMRQLNRRAGRYNDDKIVRWISLNPGRDRADLQGELQEGGSDNVVDFNSRRLLAAS
ncbi:hypothetical protein [Methylobacterium organophilum]|uniref:Uncharacterized protein n=1 Tax=Methylobacterium organophilum TaxID=410 RepID=A0ABQ4TD67_METOR|nr:hypothetical protein [Methylobacterium organophilum]UMY17365.1 hypothetical protein MMB17_22530 [Methylobacterium organophilum]GJE29248.1 hypothetical protein LKMONMHP_4127 [Methylobacterium organophilum]